MLNPVEADAAARRINALNARTTRPADHAAVQFVVALVLGILGALALLHWAEPCADGQLCMGALLLPTRSNALRQLALRLRGAYLQMRIRSAQRDLAWQDEAEAMAAWELQHLPRARSITRQHIDALQRKLDACLLQTSGGR